MFHKLNDIYFLYYDEKPYFLKEKSTNTKM